MLAGSNGWALANIKLPIMKENNIVWTIAKGSIQKTLLMSIYLRYKLGGIVPIQLENEI